MAQPELDQSKEEALRGAALNYVIAFYNTQAGAMADDYLPDLATDVFRFLKGEYVPFDERAQDDPVKGVEGNVIHVDFGGEDHDPAS